MTQKMNGQLGALLRRFRARNNKSQEDVARDCHIAHNYYGEIERGKREPGRATLLGIARQGLELNTAETNLVLLAAGYASLPQSLTSLEMSRLYRLVEAFLQKMQPYPALLAGQLWYILKWNAGLPPLVGAPLESIPARQRHLLRLVFDPALPWRASIADWHDFAGYMTALFQRATLNVPHDNDYESLLKELLRLPDFEMFWENSHPDMADGFLGREWRFHLPDAELTCRLAFTGFDQYSQLTALTFFPANGTAMHIMQQFISE